MKLRLCILFLCAIALYGLAPLRAASQTQKDYLSGVEADKIREAETPNERISLFLAFADDRLKKLQYEMEHPSQTNHAEMINSLLNAYVGCVDDAADLIQLGIEKQQNIRKGIDLMASRTKDFLVILQKIPTDASREADAAKKNVAPPPVRRKK